MKGKYPSAAGGERSESPLSHLTHESLPFRFRVWLPSTQAALNRAVARVRRLLKSCSCNEDTRTDVEIAVREALANAISHGNTTERKARVFLRCYGGDEGILIAVRDQGSGFDPGRVPDPRSPERMQLSHGRGLLLMRELMDWVEFRHGGREVVLFRSRR